MNISSLSESYQDMIYKVYQESTPESDFPSHTNLLLMTIPYNSTLYSRVVENFGYKPFICADRDPFSVFDPESRPLVAELSSLFAKIATSSSLVCNIHSYIFSKKVYVSPKKQSYQNTFPNYSKISIRSHDRWIANIYLSIFGNYYLVDVFRYIPQMDEEIATLTHLLNQDYGYRNIFDDYTESDLQQVLPIYGAHHGSSLTSEYRDRYNFFRKSPHFIDHLSNESAMHTHWTYVYQSELGFLGEWEEYTDELDDIVLSQEVMHHIWLLTQDINSKREPQSKINITAEGKVTPFPFRLRDLLFGEFLTITECRHIQAEIMSRLNGILKKNS